MDNENNTIELEVSPVLTKAKIRQYREADKKMFRIMQDMRTMPGGSEFHRTVVASQQKFRFAMEAELTKLTREQIVELLFVDY